MTRMSISTASPEYARHVVDSYTRGVICAGEVWNQFVDHTTHETFPLFMAQLTAELQRYFRHHVFVHYHDACRSEQERQALGWLSEYYESHDA
jgi:hypothetical protein